MTPEEKAAAKELAKLQKAATKLGVVFTPESTAEQLAPLVAEAQAKAEEEKAAAKPASLTEPVEGQQSYYVWNEKSESVAIFNEDVHKGEAFQHAKELADQHKGWTIT